jgi:excisionase family DNA binding protein
MVNNMNERYQELWEASMKNSSNSSPSMMKQVDNSTTNPLWTVVDVARYLRLKTETVRGMVRRGEIPGMKVGRVWRFRSDSIKNKFMEEGLKD